MAKAVYQPDYWHYLTGDFLNRVKWIRLIFLCYNGIVIK